MNKIRYASILFRFIILILISLFIRFKASAQENMLCKGSYWTEDEANLMMKEFSGMWNDRATWEKRAELIRNGIIEGLQITKLYKIKENFNAILSDPKIMDGYRVLNVAIESFPGFYITGNLYLPAEDRGKHPAILSPHGHWHDPDDYGRFRDDMQYRCASFARMGAVVFAYDMAGYGESIQVSHDIKIALLLQTWNSRRVLEYLLSRPDVDPSMIGMTGASGGATQTFVLAAIDDRIRVAAPVVQISAHFFGGCTCESGMPIHRSTGHQTNNVEIAALFAPKPMLIISDGSDYTRNTPRIEYPYIQRVYALYDAEHKVENVHFAAQKHDYGKDKRAPVYNFFSYYLNLDLGQIPYDNGFREDFVKILSREELSVFGENNPFPAHALKGNEEVIDYLRTNYLIDY